MVLSIRLESLMLFFLSPFFLRFSACFLVSLQSCMHVAIIISKPNNIQPPRHLNVPCLFWANFCVNHEKKEWTKRTGITERQKEKQKPNNEKKKKKNKWEKSKIENGSSGHFWTVYKPSCSYSVCTSSGHHMNKYHHIHVSTFTLTWHKWLRCIEKCFEEMNDQRILWNKRSRVNTLRMCRWKIACFLSFCALFISLLPLSTCEICQQLNSNKCSKKKVATVIILDRECLKFRWNSCEMQFFFSVFLRASHV